jgi:hypothetical protein
MIRIMMILIMRIVNKVVEDINPLKRQRLRRIMVMRR